MAERFKREARTAGSLSHPHIIPIYAVKEAGELLFFVMKFVEGRPLDGIIREVGALPFPMAQTIMQQVGSALATRIAAASSIATSSPRTSCSTSTAGRW